MNKIKQLYAALALLTYLPCLGKSEEPMAEEQVKEGNFLLVASQQPAPLFSFGQTVVGKGVLMGYLFIDHLQGCNKRATLGNPYLLYGISDATSVVVGVPIFGLTENNTRSSGFGDLAVQFEHIVFNKSKKRSSFNISVVGALSLPTGAIEKIPATGAGAHGFFLGAVASHIDPAWYYFTSYGGRFFTKNDNGVRPGSQFLYQAGLGRNIATFGRKWIFSMLTEVDGFYTARDASDQGIVPNTGSNIFYISPSIWLSSDHLILQAGVGFPLAQRFNGIQNKDYFYVAISLAWTFSSIKEAKNSLLPSVPVKGDSITPL